MICKQPNVRTPVDFEGESLNVMVDAIGNKVWVCIDGEAVFRAKNLKAVTFDDQRLPSSEKILSYLDKQGTESNPLLPILLGVVSRLDTAIDVLTQIQGDNELLQEFVLENQEFMTNMAIAGLFLPLVLKVQRLITTNNPDMLKEGAVLVYDEDQRLCQEMVIDPSAYAWFGDDFKMYVSARLWANGTLQLMSRIQDQEW